MSDTIGRITFSPPTPSGTFPLVTRWPFGRTQARTVIAHQFGSGNSKIEQRFLTGDGATRYIYRNPALKESDRRLLRDFWETTQGCVGAFTYAVPSETGSFSNKTVCFENVPLSFQYLSDMISSNGVTMLEIPDPAGAPTYTLNSTVTRFPNSTLNTALLGQEHQIIPLVRISVLEAGVPDIFLSDRRCTIGSQLYLPRLLRIGDPGSDVLVGQSIDGSSDDTTFSFGNADRVMVRVANDTELRWGRIELSLFHVATGIKLDLWAGYIIDWNSDAGPEFTLRASDILSALTLSSPVGRMSRRCFRRYQQDGCPATGTIDTTHFPAGDPLSCDLGYNTPNGCMAHQAYTAFGAQYAVPQSVLLTDFAHIQSGGGFGPSTIPILNATSIVSDTIYNGGTLPEIWHNDDGVLQYGLPVTCPIVSVRDEDQFLSALGIVGKGPLGAYTAPAMWDSDGDGVLDTFVGSTLDGQPNHGFQVNPVTGILLPGAHATFGLRQGLGSDPAGSTDYFCLGRVAGVGQLGAVRNWFVQPGDQGPMREIEDTLSDYLYVFSAGRAFCEIRRTDAKGIQPSSPDSHTMVAMISKGLAGWVWTAPGSNSSVNGLTNPFWVAVNTLLRALGLNGASRSTQEQYFDVAAAVAAGAIADLTVAKLFGTGTETQFRFKGVISDIKPVRDWLQACLNNGLGYYTWSFGKLKVGIRENASVVSAFTSGNMLFNSLRLQPVKPNFEKLTVKFADQEFQFQSNTVDYTDQDYAGRNNRIQNPLSSTLELVGCSTKSQAARIAVTRTREELGGVGQSEQTAARNVSWRTTIMALETEAGMVCNVTDADMPGGSGKCRIQSWRLMRDWSIDIAAKTVTDSMYDYTMGPKPSDVQPAPVPVEAPHNPPAPFPWNAGYEAPISGDAMITKQNFGIKPNYVNNADGSATVQIIVKGNPPLSTPSKLIGTPLILSATPVAVSGSLKAGTYVLAVTAFDAADGSGRSKMSFPATVIIPSNGYKVTITVQWPANSFGGNLFVASPDTGQGWHLETPPTMDAGSSTNGTTVSYDLSTVLQTYVGPIDTLYDHTEIDVIPEIHGGVWGAPCTAVTPTTLQFAGQTFTTNQFAGCVVSLLAYLDVSKNVGIVNLAVASNTADTLTIGPNSSSVTPADLTLTFSPGDVWVMRTKPTAADATSVTDANFVNSISGSGLAVHAESGNRCYILAGTGAGQIRTIVDNTATKLTVTPPWNVVPDSTSRILVLAPAPTSTFSTVAAPMGNYVNFTGLVAAIETINYQKTTVLIAAYTADAAGDRTAVPALRELYVEGTVGAIGNPGVTVNGVPVLY